MSKSSREEKLFRKEITILNYYREIAASDPSAEISKTALKGLTDKYKNLLEQTRFLTWVSGRLEKKLQRTNQNLVEKNIRLEATLNALTRAEAGRNAYAIIYFIAIILFVLEEFFVDPVINMVGNGLTFSILIKLLIVLLLKVSESFIEDKIRKKPSTKIS